MQSIRQRKQQKDQQRSTPSYSDVDSSRPSRCSQIFVALKLFKGVIFALVFFSIFLNWPAPKFSKVVKNWRDSGYHFNFNGHDIFYQDIRYLQPSPAARSTLLIIHGFPTSSYDWKNLVPDLQKRFERIIIPDMLGLGFSSKPRNHDYSVFEQATIMQQLLQYLNVTDIDILAHDLGDTVTQELLARSKDDDSLKLGLRIKSVCLTNGGILPSSYQPLFIQRLMLLPVFDVLVGRLANWFLYKNRLSSIFGPSTKPSYDTLRDFWSIARYNEGQLVVPFIMRYLNERKQNEKRWVSALQHTKVPLHLIYGPFDPINSPDMFLTAYKIQIPNSGVSILENTGHYPQMENESGFMNLYNDYLDTLKDSTS